MKMKQHFVTDMNRYASPADIMWQGVYVLKVSLQRCVKQPSKKDGHPIVAQYWPNVDDAGPTLYQH